MQFHIPGGFPAEQLEAELEAFFMVARAEFDRVSDIRIVLNAWRRNSPLQIVGKDGRLDDMVFDLNPRWSDGSELPRRVADSGVRICPRPPGQRRFGLDILLDSDR